MMSFIRSRAMSVFSASSCGDVPVVLLLVGLHRGRDALGVVAREHVLDLVVRGRLLVFDVRLRLAAERAGRRLPRLPDGGL